MLDAQVSRRPIGNALLPQGIVFVVVLAFVTVCAILRNVNLLVVVSGIMAAVLLICWRLSRKMLRSSVACRLMPEEIHAGESIPIQWQVENRGRSSIFNLRIEDRIRRDDLHSRGSMAQAKGTPSSTGIVVVEGILPNDNLIASYQAMFASRGVYGAGPAIVSAQFPLPLVKCWYRSHQVAEIFVAPAIGELLPGWHNQLTQRSNRFESHASRSGNNEDDFFAIRNWNAGDSLRHIHWRSTAKTGQPMVRQFESYSPRTLAVAVDLYADPRNISNSLDPNSASRKCEEILCLISTLLHQWRQNRTQKLFVGVADKQATLHSADQEPDFALRLHRRLASAMACQSPAIDEILDAWCAEAGSSCDLLVLSSREMPPEVSEKQHANGIIWSHCTNETLQPLFQQSEKRKFEGAAR